MRYSRGGIADGGRPTPITIRVSWVSRPPARLFRTAFDHAPVGLALVDASDPRRRRIVHINRTMGEILGIAPDVAAGALTADFVHPEDRDVMQNELYGALGTRGRTSVVRKRLIRGDARSIAVEISACAVPDAGAGSLVVLQVSDIMERTEQRLRDDMRELRILEDVRAALDEGRLEVHAQPICDLRTREVNRYELLVRMVAADGAIVSPGSFLPVAERHGLISDIDAWVIERGIEIARRGTGININVSAASLVRADLLEPLRGAVAQGLDPANVCFEITETAMAADLDSAIGFAERAGELGCRVVIDDFGVGFGSLTYVQRLPHVRCLKIDRTFVTDVVERSADQRIVAAVVRLAHSFDQDTVAEGIETEEALELLRSLGVRFGQGYLFGRPVPARDLFTPTESLEHQNWSADYKTCVGAPSPRRARLGAWRRSPT